MDRALLLLAGIGATVVAIGMIRLLGNYTLIACNVVSFITLLSDNIRLRRELKKLRSSDRGDSQTPTG
jgi:hypothetical protein